MQRRRAILAAIALSLGTGAAHAALIDFDSSPSGAVADGTAIDTLYSSLGVTFNNPLGGSIFARSSSLNESSPNVVSVFQTGVPAFDARWGAVEAVFSTLQGSVSIDAAILRLPEGFGSPTNAPKLEVFFGDGTFSSVLWNFGANPQPDAGGFAGWQTLSFTSTSDNISKVRLLSGQPNNGPSNFGLFDNLSFNALNGNGGGGDPTPVPEPGSLTLLAAGLAALALRARRRWVM